MRIIGYGYGANNFATRRGVFAPLGTRESDTVRPGSHTRSRANSRLLKIVANHENSLGSLREKENALGSTPAVRAKGLCVGRCSLAQSGTFLLYRMM
jgi:hypothetical protein